MTPNELRIRCATLDGWRIHRAIDASENVWITPYGQICGQGLLPPYNSSIDAINAAVLRLSEDAQFEWTIELQKILMKKHKMAAGYLTKEIATASALDRATAFVKIH